MGVARRVRGKQSVGIRAVHKEAMHLVGCSNTVLGASSSTTVKLTAYFLPAGKPSLAHFQRSS